jgi:WhiB family transcriptional regulator, redox-sensing transcriptional regulator
VPNSHKPAQGEWEADEYFFELLHPDWHRDAACRDAGELFYAPDFEVKEERIEREYLAKRLCRACPVQAECLESALARKEPHGIWGGQSEDDRRVSQRARRLELALSRG